MITTSVLSWRGLVVIALLVVSAMAGKDMHLKVNQENYLMKYGWLNPKDNPMIGEITDAGDRTKMALGQFQQMAGLNMTGEMDDATMKMMEMPRCGVKDVDGMHTIARKKRFAPQGSKWMKTDLSYCIQKYTPDMSQRDVDSEIKMAFDVWQDVTPLKFTKYTYCTGVDIIVSFVPRDHGDGNPFDGSGGTLAHAFFPQYGGDAHFDEAEHWTLNTYKGINLFQVAAHEFGHSLGLGHSNIQEALMAPFYRGFISAFQLHTDDIKGIQYLYGEKPDMFMTTTTKAGETTRPTTPTTTMGTTPPNMPDLCRDSKLDAIFMNSRKVTYGFQKNSYFVLDNSGVARGYPQKISSYWKGLPDNLDAALHMDAEFDYKASYRNGRWQWTKVQTLEERVYFFKGSNVYQNYMDGRSVDGFPVFIGQHFVGLPANIDAIFKWSGNGKTYVMKGSDYYRISHDQDCQNYMCQDVAGRVDSGYPRKLSVWRGLKGKKIDAAFVWQNGRTYFYSGSEYYRFDDYRFQVDSGYPRNINQWWYGCQDSIRDDTKSSTTMMMEGDLDDNQFMMVTGAGDVGDDVSGAPASLATTAALMGALLVALLSHVINM